MGKAVKAKRVLADCKKSVLLKMLVKAEAKIAVMNAPAGSSLTQFLKWRLRAMDSLKLELAMPFPHYVDYAALRFCIIILESRIRDFIPFETSEEKNAFKVKPYKPVVTRPKRRDFVRKMMKRLCAEDCPHIPTGKIMPIPDRLAHLRDD